MQPVEPLIIDMYPALHSEQTGLPGTGANEPAGQISHTNEPTADVYPAGHGVHCSVAAVPFCV